MATAARKRTAQTTKIPTATTTKPKPKAPRSDNLRVMPAPGALLLTVNETAYTLRFSVKHVYALIASGALPSLTIGRSRRVSVRAIEAYIEALQSAQQSRGA